MGRIRNIGCITKGKLPRVDHYRNHYRNKNNTVSPESGDTMGVSNNRVENAIAQRLDKAPSASSPTRGFWPSNPESKRAIEEISEDLALKLEILLKPIKPNR